MFAPGLNVARVNLKPLVRPYDLEQISPERVLKRLRQEIMKQLKLQIQQETFSPAAKAMLLRSFETKIGPRSVTVVAKHPAFRPLLEGQEQGQMKWLKKSKRPIPIVTDSGELIFRSATAKSMDDGRWIHPGREPTTVIEKTREIARETLKKHIKKELAQQLRAAMARAK
jgi:hypothetical protein